MRSGGILGFSTPTVTACNHHHSVIPTPTPPVKPTKFNLNNIQLYNLNYNLDNDFLKINQDALVNNISLQIMNEYNSESFANKLKVSDFMYGTTPTQNHSWAIEVMNIDGKTPLVFNEQGVANLRFPTNYTVLTDNALKVKITTTNSYANTKTAVVNGYLSKFIYTNANLNQGHDLMVKDASDFITIPGYQTVFDISTIIEQKFGYNELGMDVPRAFIRFSKTTNDIISKLVFTALNKQLEKKTKTLNDLKILKVIDVNKTIINFNKLLTDWFQKN